MAHHFAVRSEQRHAQVADGLQPGNVRIARIQIEQPVRNVDQFLGFHHRLAGRACDVILEILDKPAVEPERVSSQPACGRQIFGDPRAHRAHDGGQVLHQCAKELRTGL